MLLEGTGMLEKSDAETHQVAERPDVSYFRKTEHLELAKAIQLCVTKLSAQQQLVIRSHYLQEIPFEEIAKTLAVTRGRVSQLHRQALTDLKAMLQNAKGVDFSC
jgi:RNA polymerase sigma factor FliA